MDGCTRQDPAYRPATEEARFGGPFYFHGRACEFRPVPGYNCAFTSALGPPPPTSPERPHEKATRGRWPLRPELRARQLRHRRGCRPHGREEARDGRARAVRCSTTSSTAARAAPRSTRATAPGSCARSPTSSSARVLDFELPPPGEYAVGVMFLPRDDESRRARARGADRADDRRRGPDAARLARRPGRPLGAGPERGGGRADDPPGLRRQAARTATRTRSSARST